MTPIPPITRLSEKNEAFLLPGNSPSSLLYGRRFRVSARTNGHFLALRISLRRRTIVDCAKRSGAGALPAPDHVEGAKKVEGAIERLAHEASVYNKDEGAIIQLDAIPTQAPFC